MPLIQLETYINAPVDVCFNLSRSIDLHTQSMEQAGEKAIAGVTSGFINEGETVTWEARHFGIVMHMTSKITALQQPHYFRDEMVEGPFKKLKHHHIFREENGGTLMIDEFEFASPLGCMGKLADILFLKTYMKSLLQKRNSVIQQVAEEQVNVVVR
ncbi:hypothetical protein SAMN05421788_112102 [Filimonas lacunae]|uniref:Ligand-binding SRPBCC domain-containing protein n=1 Tax=Filimonas lacunae TaxID=477680 RepID=A0A173ML14_9BACT|nr:SRPBCC family protein [Filimonas lacunae]BAV08294.1 hypothetical protein FLA_4330 [Filimonas lacunae]SIT33280.1 hypothetical protein SAMN05421788_112102 [Filimonas lacunae]